MLIPHGEGTSRSFSISIAVLKLVLGIAIVAAATVLAGVAGVVTRAVDVARTEQLQRENAVLSEELARLDQRITELSDTLAVITLRDEQVRLIAGLEQLSADVRRAGIGGPSGLWPERERLISEGGAGGRRALGVAMDLDALLRRANLISASFREAAESLNSHVRRLAATPSIMPTAGFLTSNFSALRRHPILHENRPHEGLDIAAPYGTPIIAPAAGRVTNVGWQSGYGLAVTIEHGFGLETRYAHMSRTAVTVGQTVRRGDRLGFVGSTGLSTGPHLHYEVLLYNRPQDPLRYVMPNAIAD